MDLVEKTNSNARHPWETARLKVIMSLIKKHYVNHKKPVTILDIGCGDTFIAENIVKKYPEVNYLAVDTAFTEETIIEYRNSTSGLNIQLYKQLGDIDLPNSIDFVFLFDVIEHIENDTDFLISLNNNKLLKNDCTIFITVPAYNKLFTDHDIFLKHFRRYNDKMLKTLCKDTGFTKVSMGSFFAVLLIPRILEIVRNKIKHKNNSKGIGSWESKPVIDNIIDGILYCDYKILNGFNNMGIKIPGLSKYLICKKSV